MITPNFELMLWVLLISWFISGIARVIAGSLKLKKDTHYGASDVIVGIIEIIVIVWLVMK